MRWHRNTVAIFAMLIASPAVPAQDKPKSESEVKAMLLLAKAKRQREEVTLATEKAARDCLTESGCYTDLATAEKVAKEEGKKLVFWVAMTCDESPAVRSGLSDVINVHLPEMFGRNIPRVVFPVADKEFESIGKDIISPDDLALIRKKMGLPQLPKS